MASSRHSAAARKTSVRLDVAAIVDGIRGAIRDGAFFVDPALLDELESESDFSSTADGRLVDPTGLSEISAAHLPSARTELDAVVRETETAADAVMAAAECIERIVETVDEALRVQVTAQLMNIYQACSFQDITGQRIANVGRSLDSIEFVAISTLAVLGDEAARKKVDDHIAAQLNTTRPSEEAGLLHGPQIEGSGNSQDEIDNILASFD